MSVNVNIVFPRSEAIKRIIKYEKSSTGLTDGGSKSNMMRTTEGSG
jgi:hypothetical protein